MATTISEGTHARSQGASPRSRAPVFVLGCPRSGTTVLYHMLLSAGGFAVYRAESNVFNLLAPRFGSLNLPRNRERMMHHWLRSKLFHVSGLDAQAIRAKISDQCRSAGDFLRTFMEEVARQQGVERWADCTPDHLLYIREIKRQIPDALIIHIIRDGRDVALSYAQQGWSHPLPWDRGQQLGVAALYWSWIVRQGREQGCGLGSDYFEVRYEDLVTKPREVLPLLAGFIEQELDYARIQSVGIGSVSAPNSSFLAESTAQFNPIDRWKNKLSPQQLATLEVLVGDLLQELGYPLADVERAKSGVRIKRMRALYPQIFALKLWLKNHTLLGRFANTSLMEICGQDS